MKNYIKPSFSGVMLNVTDACNLRCRYCFVEKHPHYMTLDTAKDVLKLLVEINKDNPKSYKHVNFFGGEPTLMWDELIVPLVEFSKEEFGDQQIHFGMTSNGILLNESRLKWMADNEVSLLFSMDGDKEVQDYNRPSSDGKGSFDLLGETIMLIPKYLPNTTYRGTIIPKTCDKLFQGITFASACGYKSCFFCPNEFETWTEEDCSKLAAEVRKYTMYFIDSFRRNERPMLFSPFAKAYKEIVTHNDCIKKNEYLSRNCTMCGLGSGTVSINYEGKIFGCQELPSRGCENNLYYLGDIYKGIDLNRKNNLLNRYTSEKVTCEKPSYCIACPRYKFCQSVHCHANSYLLYGNTGTKSYIRCFWDRLMFTEATTAMQILSANKNEEFAKYFNEQVGRSC